VSVKEIYMLPRIILIDVETLLEYPDINVEDVMRMIKKRYPGTVKFTLDDLREYIEILNKKKDSILPVPISASDIRGSLKQDNNLDNSAGVDFRNRAAVMEYFIKKGLERLKRIEDAELTKKDMILEVQIVWTQMVKALAEIVEKQEKLKLSFQDSSKYNAYIKEQVDKLLIIIKSVIKRVLTKEKYREVTDELEKVLKLYKF